MAQGVERIGRSDIIWSYFATIFQVGAGVFLLPVILHYMSSETIGLWSVFQMVTALVLLLDFGFRPSFARNISYIFSGVRNLQKEGVESRLGDEVDFTLLKSTIKAMRDFYRKISVLVYILLASVGTWYFVVILGKYQGDYTDAIVAWILLCVINCYELYTYYYDALLTGKGYVKRSQQIMVLSRVLYLLCSFVLVVMGCGLTAIVASQMISIIIRRVLSYRVFFNPEMKASLKSATDERSREVLESVKPNAVKVGLTYLGGFCVNKSTLLLGSLFLTLEETAIFGITFQVMDVLTRCATVRYQACVPRIVEARAKKDNALLRSEYRQCVVALLAVMIVGGAAWLAFGDFGLRLIKSQTDFLPFGMLLCMLIVQLLEKNHMIAAGFIQADNRIPFFLPSLYSGAATVVLLWVFLSPMHLGLWALLLAPGIVQLAYQNWRWPLMLIKEIR